MSVELPADPVMVRCDPRQMQQVLMNLAINARDAMAGEGHLILRMTADRELATISVADTGPGISADILPHIFEPLFTTKNTGTGLGLAVVRQLVTGNGGSVDVRATSAAGAEFCVRLPVTNAVEELSGPAPVAAEALPPVTVQRVLLVDDDEIGSEGITMLLELEGFAVRTVGRAAEVADAVAQFRPDVVILDLTLPDGNGADIYRSLMSAHPGLPVVFASGHADPDVLRERTHGGRVALLKKPYDFLELMDQLRLIA
jgi:two-component system cell cycle sensor histidine kinase/response regulator CckA